MPLHCRKRSISTESAAVWPWGLQRPHHRRAAGLAPLVGCGGAAGNVVDPRAQVITAAGAGSAAAIALNADLAEHDVHDAVHAFHQGFTS
jgi:hypothetical protein